jgi:AcrR family transcriptional regulator
MDSKRQDGASQTPRARIAKSRATSARILDAARDLFNERGTSAVSTNHIAAAAGLSPGNLYYHFTDKKEIIRRLHAQYAAAHEDWWGPGPGGPASLVTLRRNVAEGMTLAWRYRFLGREILALLRADAQLRASYHDVYERRLNQWLGFAEQLRAQGLMRQPRPPGTLRDLTVAVWLIAENWLAFLDVVGNPDDPDQVARGSDLVLAVLDPYLTARGRRRMHTSTAQPATRPATPIGDIAAASPDAATRERSSSHGPQPT